ncbi:MAG: PaaI family thioesterase [Actinobacteria bacterium]|nr:PaaI family thioesterase [Actinomycetota bacterium]
MTEPPTIEPPAPERLCFGCAADNDDGLRLDIDYGEGRAIAHLTPRPGHEGPPGHLHGGVAAAALDEAMGAAAHDQDGVFWVTAQMTVRYRLPVPLAAGPYRLEAEVVKDSGRRRRVSGRLLLPDGSSAVEGTAIFVRVGSPPG